MSEKNLMKEIQIEASKRGARLFRNNCGTLQDRNGKYVRYGLAVGSSDLIGLTPVTITPNMVGKTIAVFLAVEVKTPTGRLSQAQRNFLDAVNKSGGVGICARSVDDLSIL